MKKNDSAIWLKKSSLNYSYDSKSIYSISFDGITKTFSITTTKNETKRIYKNKEVNLHTYLYVKYEDDENYRWKYRIIIGGVMEGIQLFDVVSTTEEELLNNDIEIKEGDKYQFKIRAKFVPTTIRGNNDNIWYISGDPLKIGTYSYNSASYEAPVPTGKNDERANALRLSLTENPALNFDGMDFYKYYESSAVNGIDDITVKDNLTGESVYLVCLNKATKKYATVRITDVAEKEITVKSIASNSNAPTSYKEVVSFNDSNNSISATRVVNVSVNGKTGFEQVYPNTIQVGYESSRTFYQKLNSTLILQLESNFDIEDISVIPDSDASSVFAAYTTTISSNGLEGTVNLPTKYSQITKMDESDRNMIQRDCLSHPNGVYLTLRINSKYDLKIRVIVYNNL